MSEKSKQEYLETRRLQYPSRNRTGKSAMVDEVSDTFGWSRKHTIKALNKQVRLGSKAKKRGRKPIYGEPEKMVIVDIWKSSEQPCGVLLKQTLPLWIESYEIRNGKLPPEVHRQVLKCSPRQLDRITKPHKIDSNRYGRKTGRTSHRLKQLVPVQCGPHDVDRPGYFEADTVSHGGGSSSGEFMWSLTLTDIHSGWTELYGLWGNTGGEVCQGLQTIENRMPMELLGFDCDNGSEFLNTTLESYLLSKTRKVKWTRSRPYKKNDQAHVEQKNFTHVRQLLGYGRFCDIELKALVNDLYETAWLPLRNYFTPVMKLVKKTRIGSKVKKEYDVAKTPCDRVLECKHVSEKQKKFLRSERSKMDPYELAEKIEKKLKIIFEIVGEIEERRAEEKEWEKSYDNATPEEGDATAAIKPAPAPVAIAPSASAGLIAAESLAKIN